MVKGCVGRILNALGKSQGRFDKPGFKARHFSNAPCEHRLCCTTYQNILLETMPPIKSGA